MTRDDFQRFLDRVGASSLRDYLGKAGRDEAIAALEEKLAWAVAHRNDPEMAEVADFLARNVDALKSVLDEGEPAWWERTATVPRVRKPESGAWGELDSFATPAPPERANPTIVADETPEAPVPALRRGRNLPDEIALPEAEAVDIPILPEAVDTPGTPVRGQAPPSRDETATVEAPPSDETWAEEELHLDPDPTDPIGFTAIPLSAAERDRDTRLASARAAESPRQPAVTFGLREIGDDEPTDPSMPRLVLTPPRPPPLLPPTGVPGVPGWMSTLVMVAGGLVMILGTVAILFVIARVGRQQGKTFAEEAWRKAHVTSTTTVETPPEPIEPLPSPDPDVVAPAPAPVAPAPAPAPAPPLALAGSTWVGTGGTGPLTLKIDAYERGALRGRLIRTTGGIAQTTPVTGTWDEASGAFVLGGESVAMTGTLRGTTARGTWAPDGTSHQWLLARQ